MPMTMLQKIFARTAGVPSVAVGDVLSCRVDWAVEFDLPFARSHNRPVPNKVWNPDRIVLVLDHVVPAPTVVMADGLKAARDFARRMGLRHFYPEGRNGICHQVVAELGYALPGQLLACGDSHSSASGAFNCAARGLGSMEMLYILCKGQTWFDVCPTVRYEFTGRLSEGVYPRDVIHFIAGRWGEHLSQNIEYGGPGLASLDIAARQTIATMSTELSAEFATFEYDERTAAYLRGRAKEAYAPVFSDPGAGYADVRRIDLDALEPQIVLPHFVPNNVKPLSAVAGLKIDQGFIGSCANGRIEDLRVAAAILKGRAVHPDARLIITPASTEVAKQAAREGLIEIFLEAGAIFTNPTCGAYNGGHLGLIGAGERCLTASTRNFKGRMGSRDAEILMGSPAAVAAAAVRGAIVDPRTL